jgi:DnaJ family protein C protein 30
MYRLQNETFNVAKILILRHNKNFSTRTKKNLYDVLQITPHAKHADIKTAYYKLSKVYHPDVNSTVEAADKFREITDAYNVLGMQFIMKLIKISYLIIFAGNYRLKKLYDKGIIHTAGKEYAQHATSRTQAYDTENEENDDPQTKFYKARMKHQKSKIYDFDEWTEGHYGKMFDEKQKQKKKAAQMQYRELRQHDSISNRNISFITLITIFVFGLIAELSTTNLDKDKVDTKK